MSREEIEFKLTHGKSSYFIFKDVLLNQIKFNYGYRFGSITLSKIIIKTTYYCIHITDVDRSSSYHQTYFEIHKDHFHRVNHVL